MGRKAKSKNVGDLPEDEKKRRENQRYLRSLALKLRGQGEKYDRYKGKRAIFNKKRRQEQKEAKGKLVKRSRTSNSENSADGHNTSSDWKSTTVIIPIYWKSRLQERDLVLNAVDRVAGILQSCAIPTYVDRTTNRAPGQKMRYYEELGVKIRVEVGPEEAKGRLVQIARAKDVGEMAEKEQVGLNDLPNKIRRYFEEIGVSLDLQEPSKSDAGREISDSPREESADEGAQPENDKPDVKPFSVSRDSFSQNNSRHGGEDLEDDFVIEDLDNTSSKASSTGPRNVKRKTGR